MSAAARTPPRIHFESIVPAGTTGGAFAFAPA